MQGSSDSDFDLDQWKLEHPRVSEGEQELMMLSSEMSNFSLRHEEEKMKYEQEYAASRRDLDPMHRPYLLRSKEPFGPGYKY